MRVDRVNCARFRVGQRAGHYESFFLRANHPERPLAFWIRYTILSPDRRPEDAVGELWIVFFDGERRSHIAVKHAVPMGDCRFAEDRLDVAVGDAVLGPRSLRGAVETQHHHVSYDLAYGEGQAPLLLFAEHLYERRLPKAKALVGSPLARFDGELRLDGRSVQVDGWPGSQNHNWGSRHTDLYAWGQVAGFDDNPDSFLEVATARLRVGPVWSPWLSPLVLRHRGQELALNSIAQSLRNHGRFECFRWELRARAGPMRLSGMISAPRDAFVGLAYGNPPGGSKDCLNTKIATCELSLCDERTGDREQLRSENRAAFEIVTDDRSHGVDIRA